METKEELEKLKKELIEKLQSIDKYIRDNTNSDERGIFPKDPTKLLINEIDLMLQQGDTISRYLGLIDKRLELLDLKEKIK